MGRGYGDWYDRWQPPSKPRSARGGIKARTRRGEFAENWWARRWQEVLARACSPSRLSRGRAYARGGQVLSIDVGEGLVKARVQGSRAQPYGVSIKVETLSPKDRRKLARVLSKRALFAAKLLAGQVPPMLEEAFREAGLSLVPQLGEIWGSCTCPDWDHPCKHVVAVFCLLGEEFDRDPFLLLRLRGISREGLVEMIGGTGSGRRESARPGAAAGGEGAAGGPGSSARPAGAGLASDVELSPEDVERFWQGREAEGGAVSAAAGHGGGDGAAAGAASSSVTSAAGVKGSIVSTARAGSARAMLASLDRPRFWRGEKDLEEVLWKACDAAAGLAVALLEEGVGPVSASVEGDAKEAAERGKAVAATGKQKAAGRRASGGAGARRGPPK